jgi:16S rRNA (cytosine1402-N4)-methyltransferase
MQPPHLPVLYQQIIHALCPQSPGRYIDATVGAGGHSLGILESSSPNGCLLGFDLDPQALEIASQRLSSFYGRVTLVQASYTSLAEQMKFLKWNDVQGIVIDLGVSSMQFDYAEKGFSFLKDGPLDMRFNPDQPVSAADLVNNLSENELADLIFQYGEEPQSRRIARVICQTRPHTSTVELAAIIQSATGAHGSKIHPATRTFQALRIAVNGELDSLKIFLPQAVAALSKKGRLAVISFHSLEDRIVKQFFRLESTDCLCPPSQPVCTCGHIASIKLINRHPIVADDAEVKLNPRARSARLRIIEKL